MAANIFANAQALFFGAKTEDLQGRAGTGLVTLNVNLQRFNTQVDGWETIAVAGDAYAHEPGEITFGDETTEGLVARPASMDDWHAAQSGDRIVYKTGEDADDVFVTINLVS